MKLNQLLYFKTVAETGKISVAAKKLFVTAPALSIAIGNLEKELGVKLFERANNRIVLNEQGKVYLELINKILEDLALANEKVRAMTPESDRIYDDSELTTEDESL